VADGNGAAVDVGLGQIRAGVVRPGQRWVGGAMRQTSLQGRGPTFATYRVLADADESQQSCTGISQFRDCSGDVYLRVEAGCAL
jgi:hypothetical protein